MTAQVDDPSSPSSDPVEDEPSDAEPTDDAADTEGEERA